jgi:hypothetical protein
MDESKAERFEIWMVKALPSSEHCLGHVCGVWSKIWIVDEG